MEEGTPLCRVAVNILSSRGQPTRCGPPDWWWARKQILTVKIVFFFTKYEHLSRTWTDTFHNLNNEKGTWYLVRGMLGACRGQVHLQHSQGIGKICIRFSGCTGF